MRTKNARILCALLLLIPLLLYGCTPEKAKALQTAVVQFKVEALKAIDMIDALREQELAPPPVPQTERVADFVSGVTSYRGMLTTEKIASLVSPYAISAENRPATEWDRKRDTLRQQYTEFAAIFARLDAGSYLAADAVAQSKALARDLTLQLAVFAKVIKDNPPRFIQYRSQFVTDLIRIKNDSTLTEEKRRQAIAPYFERWQNLARDERQMGDDTVAQCLKAALLGQRVCELAESYDRLSLDDLNTIIARTLDTVGALTGEDTSRLGQRVDSTIAAIEADAMWAGAVDTLLQELNKAAAAREETL